MGNLNNRLKFRAWNNKTKVMVFNDASLKFIMGSVAVTHYKYEDLIIQQYTGLKDKNGKEIYEGDVLSPLKKMPYKNPPKDLLCTVVWNEEYCTFGDLQDNQRCGDYALYGYSAKHCWEIIGNIYENPELINK